MLLLTRTSCAGVLIFLLASLALSQESLAKAYVDGGLSAYRSGRFEESELLFRRALGESKNVSNEELRFEVAKLSLNGLTLALRSQRKFAAAEEVARDMIKLLELNPSDDAGDLGIALNNLGLILREENKVAESEAVHRKALALRETIKDGRANVAISMLNLGALFFDQERYSEARVLFIRASDILNSEVKQATRDKDMDLLEEYLLSWATCRQNLAAININENRQYSEALTFVQQAITAREITQGKDHPDLIDPLSDYAKVLRKLGRTREAIAVEARVRKLKAK